jgi:hypothetical protein
MFRHEGACPQVRPKPGRIAAGDEKAGGHSIAWSRFAPRFCWKPETR